jgi:hypothetical protein
MSHSEREYTPAQRPHDSIVLCLNPQNRAGGDESRHTLPPGKAPDAASLPPSQRCPADSEDGHALGPDESGVLRPAGPVAPHPPLSAYFSPLHRLLPPFAMKDRRCPRPVPESDTAGPA